VKVEYTEESSVRKALSFEIEPEVVDKEYASRAREYSKKARLPGFRAGKVPLSVVKKRFKEQIEQDVAEALVNRVVFDEIEGRGLKPLAAPRVEELKIAESEPLRFKAVFETLPEVELPEYRGLEVRVQAAAVSDADVDRELDRLREDAARFDPVEDRPAREGDHVVADVSWTPVGGGTGGSNENALLEIGDENNAPEINAALVGSSAGETRQAHIEYPQDHANPSLAGQTFDYELKVTGIKQKVVPQLDDEFAKDLDHDDLEALRKSVKERLLAAEEQRADRDVKRGLVEELVKRASFDVPEALVERHMNARTENVARGLAMQGIDPSKVDMDWRRYRESQRDDSVKAARADILLDGIARQEKVNVSDAELDVELDRLAARLKKSREALKAQMTKENDLASLRARMREEKILDLLKASARLAYEERQ
jgi:trigger factor